MAFTQAGVSTNRGGGWLPHFVSWIFFSIKFQGYTFNQWIIYKNPPSICREPGQECRRPCFETVPILSLRQTMPRPGLRTPWSAVPLFHTRWCDWRLPEFPRRFSRATLLMIWQLRFTAKRVFWQLLIVSLVLFWQLVLLMIIVVGVRLEVQVAAVAKKLRVRVKILKFVDLVVL